MSIIRGRRRLHAAMQLGSPRGRPSWLHRGVVPAVVTVGAVFASVTGCSTAGEETGTSVEEVQEADDGVGADAGALWARR